jgi:cytochrome c oxidase accessory protein FixG
VLFYGLATYGNAGWMREQVCKYMCPYARFQSAMFDPDTLVVTYDPARGEPRGSRSRKADTKALGLGACVDCNICVQVCPTGIDIREGLQYECIGCAACIDGCDEVMDKMGYPRGLIRFSTENALRNKWGWREIIARVLRVRVLVYTGILAAIAIAGGVSLYMRVPVKMDVMVDRASMAREVDDGHIENVYRVQLMNTEERARRMVLTATGDHHEELHVLADTPTIELAPLATRMITVRVRAEHTHHRESKKIRFVLESRDEGARPFKIREKSRFLYP